MAMASTPQEEASDYDGEAQAELGADASIDPAAEGGARLWIDAAAATLKSAKKRLAVASKKDTAAEDKAKHLRKAKIKCHAGLFLANAALPGGARRADFEGGGVEGRDGELAATKAGLLKTLSATYKDDEAKKRAQRGFLEDAVKLFADAVQAGEGKAEGKEEGKEGGVKGEYRKTLIMVRKELCVAMQP